MFTFFALDQKNPFWANLVKKIKIVNLSKNLLTFSVFDHKYLSWANLVRKTHKCLFKVKFDTKTNLNMQNSMVVSILYVLD